MTMVRRRPQSWWGPAAVLQSSCRFALLILWFTAVKWLPLVPANAQARGSVIACLGNSITAGVGVKHAHAYPQVLASDLNVRVVVEGIPGATAEDGLAHVDRVLAHKPWLVVVELGGNDVLRKIEPQRTERALRDILKRILATGATALLVEVPAPPDTGHMGLHRRLAEELDVPLLGDVLPKILHDSRLKVDSVHPNAAGHQRLAATLADRIRPWIEERSGEERTAGLPGTY